MKDSCLPFSICNLFTARSLIFILFTGPLFDLHVIYRLPFLIHMLFCRLPFSIYMLFTGPLFGFTCFNRRLDSSVDRTSSLLCGRPRNRAPDQTNTWGLKITEEKVLPLQLYLQMVRHLSLLRQGL